MPTPPPRVLSVQRWVGPSGTVSVAGQRLSLGLANVGRLITVVIEGHQFRVFAEGPPLKTIARRPRAPGVKEVIRPRSNRRANPNQLGVLMG